MKYAQLGTVICGTLREADLFPAFLSTLKELDPSKEHLEFVSYLEKELRDPLYIDSEAALWDLERLGDILNDYAPPHAFFGTNEGDGADFGFWLFPNFLLDYEGLRVLELALVPPGTEGEVLVQSPTGAISLYEAKNDGSFELIWSL